MRTMVAVKYYLIAAVNFLYKTLIGVGEKYDPLPADAHSQAGLWAQLQRPTQEGCGSTTTDQHHEDAELLLDEKEFSILVMQFLVIRQIRLLSGSTPTELQLEERKHALERRQERLIIYVILLLMLQHEKRQFEISLDALLR